MILKLVLALIVKPTDILLLWKINKYHCVNGKSIKGMQSYGATRASTVHLDTVQFQFAYGTSSGFSGIAFNCTNAFKCTLEDDPNKRIY